MGGFDVCIWCLQIFAMVGDWGVLMFAGLWG